MRRATRARPALKARKVRKALRAYRVFRACKATPALRALRESPGPGVRRATSARKVPRAILSLMTTSPRRSLPD